MRLIHYQYIELKLFFRANGKKTGSASKKKKHKSRNHGSDSEYSYASEESEGGTRHVRRRRKHDDGTYSDSESYQSNSSDSESSSSDSSNEETDSDFSYMSETSEGGTRYELKKKRVRDADGNIIGYESPEPVDPKMNDAESLRIRRGNFLHLPIKWNT